MGESKKAFLREKIEINTNQMKNDLFSINSHFTAAINQNICGFRSAEWSHQPRIYCRIRKLNCNETAKRGS